MKNTKDHSIVVTYFEPFGGRQVNLTNLTAHSFKSELERLYPSLDIVLCELPVEYDRAAAKAMECIEKNQNAKFVLGLGEGNCKIKLETAANNLDHTKNFPDNAGVSRENTIISKKDPTRVAFRFPMEKIFCAIPTEWKNLVVASHSPGNYVCNNLSFHLATKLKIPFGFIHVPHDGCAENLRDTDRNGKILAGAFSKVLLTNGWSAFTSASELPTTKSAIKNNSINDEKCSHAFWDSLLFSYESEK